ncbi:MAG: SBBP repeat-containing protein, partial [Bacteroidetes bacterium]|nr:SBBP repeat-containing protein [Bacteroidota bacterium]
QLVQGQIANDEITNISDFPYNDPNRTLTHPSISADGKELYFAANIDSTIGGSDIFVSKLNSSGNFVWAKKFGSTLDDFGNSITLDVARNVYTVGRFQGTVDFDPGLGTSNLVSVGNEDIYISKLNSAGNFVWAKRIGGVGNEYGSYISHDALGNIYIIGYFEGTVDFDPGTSVYNLTTTYSGRYNMFILKLDASGNFAWVKQVGGGLFGSANGYSMVFDNVGSIYATGFFQGINDFDPDTGIFNLTSNGINNNFNADVFILKLSSSGSFKWAKNLGGSDADWAYSIAVDNAKNVYSTGYFNGSADFDPDTGSFILSSMGSTDIFISKLDSLGSYVWAKRIGGMDEDEGRSIILDDSGNVYTTGFYRNSVDLDPGIGVVLSGNNNSSNSYLLKLFSSGNFAWVNGIYGGTWERGYSLVFDSSKNIYVTGTFSDTVDFDASSNTYNLISSGYGDIFVLKLNKSGVLPVSFLNFEAFYNNSEIHFLWSTANEINNSHYIIEKSLDNKYWSMLGTVHGKGTTNVITEYKFVNRITTIPQKQYYRIKQVDFDGKFDYSKTICIDLNE